MTLALASTSFGDFKLDHEFVPRGDQPNAIARLVEGTTARNLKHQTLLGVTGSGKTYTMANIVAQVQRPTLVIAHNKTLAAQLATEFQEYFPHNSVQYFVSYYDYYQPEAYIPSSDVYIEKETDINEEIDRLRHAATRALMTRRDVLIVASVSCIYGLGSPQEYSQITLSLRVGDEPGMQKVVRRLISMYYDRNDFDLRRGRFRVRGDVLEVMPADEDIAVRVEFFGDEIERITRIDPLTGEVLNDCVQEDIYPGKHFITPEEEFGDALRDIETELDGQLIEFREQGKLLEAERLEQRTNFDLEMLRETGHCAGIENYSQPLGRRPPGSPPWTLLDYFPDDYLLFIDESHMTLPQLHAMFHGEMARKDKLIDYGFRLPSARDNRPLHFEEFEDRVNQVIFVSATPGPYESKYEEQRVEMINRPTGLIDPVIEIEKPEGQIDDLLDRIQATTAKGQRVLVTTLTKRMAEDLADYLREFGIKVHYLHSEIDTLQRAEIIRDLRLGIYDVVVGINLLREGIDLPEVSLVAILDADKEGFLRSDTSLIQTIGRAARHIDGKVVMYCSKLTESIKWALSETNRRRAIQRDYNVQHGIVPQTVEKKVSDITERLRSSDMRMAEDSPQYVTPAEELPKDELLQIVKDLEKQMKRAATELEFEVAAGLRDQIVDLRKVLAGRG